MIDLPHGAVLELELLRTFDTVVHLGGFTPAAMRLHCTQSTVSAQIRRLEETAGARLLERNNQGIALTPAGETLLGYARQLLRINSEAMGSLAAHELRGSVRLGIPADYTTAFLADVLPVFGHAYPNVELEVRCDLSRVLMEELNAGKLDIVVGTLGQEREGGEVIRVEPLVWAGGRHGRAWIRDPLPLAVFPPTCQFRELSLERLAAAGRRYRIAYTSPSMAGIEVAVESDFAVAPVSRSGLRNTMGELGPAEGLPELPSVEVTLHRGTGLGDPAEQLAGFLRDHAWAAH